MALMTELHLDESSVEDRLVLVDELWDSIEQSRGAMPMSLELRAELAQRVEEADRHPDDGIPWGEIRAAVLARIRR